MFIIIIISGRSCLPTTCTVPAVFFSG